MADDDLSDTSSLSSLSSLSSVPSEEEPDVQLRKEKGGILKFFHKVPKGSNSATGRASPPPPKRERAPSPPHEYVLADNQDIAVSGTLVLGASGARGNAKDRVAVKRASRAGISMVCRQHWAVDGR